MYITYHFGQLYIPQKAAFFSRIAPIWTHCRVDQCSLSCPLHVQHYILYRKNVYRLFLFAQEISRSWQWQRSLQSPLIVTGSAIRFRMMRNSPVVLVSSYWISWLLFNNQQFISQSYWNHCQRRSPWFSRQDQIGIYGHVPAKLMISNVSPSAVALPEFRLLRRSGDR